MKTVYHTAKAARAAAAHGVSLFARLLPHISSLASARQQLAAKKHLRAMKASWREGMKRKRERKKEGEKEEWKKEGEGW